MALGDAGAANVTYVGANGGYWDVAGNWNPGLPTTPDDVALGTFNTEFRTGNVTIHTFTGTGNLKISGGSLRATAASSIGSLTMAGGTLSGAGTVTAGSLTFTNGTMGESGQGGGTTTVTGATTFDGTGNQAIYYGRTLNLNGGATWTASTQGIISIYSASQGTSAVNIASGTTFADQGNVAANQTRYLGNNSDGVVNNAGTYTRSGLGTTQVSAAFNNTGTVNVTGGTFSLNNGGTSSGAFAITSGNTLGFGSGTYALTGGSIANAGTLAVTGGTVNVASGVTYTGSGTIAVSGGLLNSAVGTTLAPGALNISSGTARFAGAVNTAALSMTGGTLSGPGTVTAGTLAFTNGTMGETGQGGGTTTVTGATTFDGTGNQYIYYGRTLNLNGGATWTASTQGVLYMYSGSQGTSTVNVASGTTFADQGNVAANQTRYLGNTSDGVFNNAGTYTRTGLGTTSVNAAFNNTGTVNVSSNGGAMSLINGGTSSGAFNVASGATLNFGSGYALTTGSIANAGTVTASSGLVTVAAPVTLTGAGALTVSGGTLRVAGNSFNPTTLNMTGGTLSGAGTVTAGTLVFTNGTMGETGQGGGTTTVTGATTFDGTSSQSVYYGRTLNLNGGVTWTTGTQGTISLYSGSQGTTTVNVASGTTFADQGNLVATQTRYLGSNNDGVINNAGTYTRTGLGTTQVNATFNNTGAVNVSGGTMSLVNGGTSSGSFNVASGTTLNFGSGYALTTGSIVNAGTVTAASGLVTVAAPVTLTGAGALTVNGGTLRVAGNSFNPTTLNITSGGTLSGAGTVTTGALAFTNGSMGESGQTAGTTTVTGAATFDGTSNQAVYYGRTLNLNGGATWTSGTQGIISIYSGGQGTTTVNVASGTTFADQGNLASNQIRYLGNNSDGIFNNAGTYTRAGLGTTQVNAVFNNTGAVSVTGGTFSLNNAGTSSGAFNVASGNTLGFGSGTYALTGGSIANAGTLAVTGATVNIASGVTYTGSGTIAVSGGLLNSAVGTTLAPGALNISGGTARFAGAVNTAALSMTGGTLSGPGTVTAGTLAFTNGTMGETGQGSGTTTVTGATTFDGTGNQYIYYGRTLNLNGGATWTASTQGVISLYSGSQGTTTVNVASGTTFADQGNIAANQARYLGNNSDGVFNNAGTYTRTGVGTTQVNAAFNNTGTVNVSGGAMSLVNGGTSSGAFNVASGTMLNFGSGYALTTGSIANAGTVTASSGLVTVAAPVTLTGAGTLTVNGGTLRVAGNGFNPTTLNVTGGTLGGAGTVTAGTLAFTGGQMGESGQGGGTTTVTGATTFDGTSAQYVYYGRTLNLNGGATWTTGTQGTIALYSGSQGTSTVNVASGTTFTDQGTVASNQTRYLGSNNDGVFNNAGTYTRTGVGTTQVSAAFNNTGTVNVNGGTLSVIDGGTSSGAFTVASSAVLNFGSGYALTTGSIANAGTVTASSGLVTVAAPVTLTGAGALTVNGGTLRVAGNSFNPTTLNITSGGTLSGAGTVTAGTLVFTNGTMGETGQGGGTTTVTGATTFDGTSAQYVYYGRTLNLNGGATWTTGTQGIISIYSGSQGTSTVNIASGTTFADQGNVAANQTRYLGYYSDSVVNNAGTYTRTGLGTTQVNATFNNTGTVNVSGGTVSLVNGGTSSGAFNVASGTTLNFGSGYALTTGSIANAGTVTASSGTVTMAAPVTLTGAGALTVNGGTLRVAGNGITPTTLNITSGGTLSGAGTVTAGTLNFTSGTMGETGQGGGTTTVTGVATFDGTTGGQNVYYGRTLNLNGATTWTASTQGLIYLYSGSQGTSTINIGSGSTFADQGNLAANQTRNLGVYSDGVINNAGTYTRTGLGTTQVYSTFNNTGTINVAAGSMNFQSGTQGTGTLQTSGTGTVTLAAASTTGVLNLTSSTANNLALGANNIVVSRDYTNAAFGTGNSFNARANVSGTGLVNGLNAAQSITGAGVTNGTAATATLTIGNVRVGTNTVNYQVANSGTGASIRGAIQTVGTGLGVSDSRLSGTGVTAQNFGPIAAGTNGGNLAVTFTAASAGALAPLTGTNVVGIVNNFDNVAEQKLNLTLGSGAAAYQVAAGSILTSPFNFGTVQVGQAVSQTLAIKNVATGPSGYVEDLNASFGASSGTGGNLITGTGSISALVAGATNSSGLTVNVNTLSAGSVSGAIAVNFASAGSVGGTSNGLGALALGSSSYGVTGTITGTVVNQASPLINNSTIALANVRVGSTSTGAVSVTNQQATSPQAALTASIAGTAPITASGSFSLLNPGATNASSLTVGLDTTTAGAKSGTATVSFISDASNIGNCAPNCQLTLPSQNVAVSGSVFQVAQASVPTSVNLGNVHVGGSASQAISIGNTNTAPTGYQEGLDVAVGTTTGGATGSGSITNLTAGNSSSAVTVGLANVGSGARSGTVALGLGSNGTGTSGLSTLALGSSSVTVNATGYNLAAGSVTPTPVAFDNQRVGGSASQALTVTNSGPSGSYTEGLNASFTGSSGATINNGGSVSLLAAQASSSALSVRLDTSSAGAKTGTTTVGFVSDGSNTSGLGTTAVGTQTISLSGNVYQVAAGSILTSPLNFGTVQVGQSVSQTLAIKNVATGPTGYVEDLNASFGASSGTGSSLISGTGSISGLVAGATNSSGLTVSVNTAAAGSVSGAIAVNFASAGAVGGTSNGLGVLSLGSSSYGVTGTIETAATVVNQASPLINNGTIALGNVRIGGTSPTTAVSVTNQSTTSPQAALTASIAGSAPITASGSFSLLNPGSTNASSLNVGMDTTSAGAKSGTATVSFISDASNIGGCAPNCQLTLASQNVSVSGGVYQVAQASLPTTINLGNVHVGGSASQSIAIGNTNTAPTGYQEGLDVAVGTTTGGATGSGSITNLTAGSSSSAVTVGLANVGAGARSGSVALGLASNGTGTSGLATLALGTSSVTVNATGYNLATGSVTPTPVPFGNQRVGGSAAQALTVTNTASSGSFTEGLNASFTGSSGAAVNNGGSVSLLAGQASNASALSVRLDTSSAGAKTGTTTVGFVSDGSGTSGLGTTAAGSQTIALSGNVYQVAAGSILTSPLNFGTVQVGQSVSQTLAIKNVATGPTGYVEDLNASFGASSGTGSSLISGTGSISGLVAGATNSGGLTVSVNTAAAGTVSGAIAVNFASAGAVGGTSNGLGVLSLGSTGYGVTGTIETAATVVNQASPLINNGTIALGNVRIGTTSPTTAVSVTNRSTTSPQAALTASIAGSAPITASGSFSLLNPGSTDASSLTVGLDTTTAGAKSGTATVSFISDASNIGNCAPNCQLTLASQNVAVSGAVYRLANASATPSAITVAGRVGSTAATTNIAITNVSPDAYTEGLTVTRGTTSSGFTSSGGITNLTAGATSSAIGVTLNTATAGTFSGSQALAYVSTGAGTTGAADLAVGSGSVTLDGKVYTPAAATVNTSGVDFGIVHVGDTVASRAVSVTNSAATTALNDVLVGQAIGATGPFTASGSLGAGLAAQQTGTSLSVGLATSAAGVYSGSASFSAASHDGDLSDAALANLAVSLTGQVNNYATDAFSLIGGAGTLTQSGSTYVLDYGTVVQNTGTRTTSLVAGNTATGPADVLDGSFAFNDVADFGETGFSSFADFIAGQSTGPLMLAFNSATLGSFVDSITLSGIGHNASGYSAAIGDLQLIVRGNVIAASTGNVPEPDSLWLLGLGIPLLALRRRSRQSALRR